MRGGRVATIERNAKKQSLTAYGAICLQILLPICTREPKQYKTKRNGSFPAPKPPKARDFWIEIFDAAPKL